MDVYMVTEWDEDEGTVVRAVCPDDETAVAFIEREYPGFVLEDDTVPSMLRTWSHPEMPSATYSVDMAPVIPSIRVSS